MNAPQNGSQKPAASKMSDLPARVASGVVMIALALAALWWGGQPFVLFWLAAAIAIIWEWLRLMGAEGNRPAFAAGAAGVAAAAALAAQGLDHFAVVPLAAGALAVAFFTRDGKLLWCAAGVFYAGLFMIALIGFRLSLLYGVQAVLWLFAVVWGTDILAYFGGRSIGGPKLWPRISPSKTWSGFLTGVTGGALAGVCVAYASMPAGRVSMLALFIMGLAVAAFSQAGDFFESAMKRKAGVKDSSQLIPGHGGVMDRLDGFNFACVLAGLIAWIKGGPLQSASALLLW